MAFTYDDTDLTTATASGRLNATRLLLGDTNSSDPQVQDAEVNFSLSENGDNVYYAAAWLARVVSSKYAREVDTELDGQLSADFSQMAKAYTKLADDLEYQGKTSGAKLGVYAGGITKTSIEAARLQTNRIKPSFRRDQFHNPPNANGRVISYDE